ncbi:MAG: hypothetical protein ACO1OB_17390 [Archangium sp.]
MFSRSDYVMRLVKQLAELLARAMKLKTAGDEAKSKEVLKSACGELLGIEFQVLDMLDAKTAVELLGEKPRVDAYVQLVEALGDHVRAAELRQHAPA